MSAKSIRVGVIGAGDNTVGRHIPGLQEIDGVEIVEVCNRTPESSSRVAKQFGIGKIHDHWTQVVESPDTDAVVIGTWPYLHGVATIATLEADKHVMCEARMARNAAEAREMLDASRQRPHLTAQIVPSPMTLGVDATIQRLLAEDQLGEILAVELRDVGAFLDQDAPLHWRQDFALSGLNIMSMGIWYEAVMRWLGPAQRVMAMGKTFVKRRRDERGAYRSVRIPEHVDVLADMECGAQLHLQVSAACGHGGGPQAFIFGTKGTIRYGGGDLYYGARSDDSLGLVDIPADESAGWRVEQEFVGAIRGQEPLRLTTFEDGVAYMEFTEAVARSLADGYAVSLPL